MKESSIVDLVDLRRWLGSRFLVTFRVAVHQSLVLLGRLLTILLHQLVQLGSYPIGRRSQTRILFHPVVNHNQNRGRTLTKVPYENGLKLGVVWRNGSRCALGWRKYRVEVIADAMLQSRPTSILVVKFRLLFIGFRLGISGLVVKGLGYENETLDAYQNLQQSRLIRHPTRARPRAEQAEAYFAALVEVGVEADFAIASGKKAYLGRRLWIVVEKNVKEEASVCVRRVLGAWDPENSSVRCKSRGVHGCFIVD
jgi:hypothetical protein